MRRIFAVLAIVSLCAVSAPRASALDAVTQAHVDQLRAQIAALEAQAQQFRDNITAQQDKAVSLSRDISILQSQIGQLQAQLNATGAQIDITNTEIDDVEGRINATQADISQKRDTIGRMILFLEERDHESLIASLFKYKDLSSFLQQFHDLAVVQGQLLATISDLKDASVALQQQQSELQQHQSELQDLNAQTTQQKQQLDSVKSEKSQILKDTKGQEALYQKQLNDVLAKESAFFQEAEQLESQVIAGGLYIVHVTATSVPKKGTKLFIKPEANPRLTQGYGCTTYARCGHRNGPYGGQGHNGVDFASGYGTPILAIGDGTILAHGTNDGWGNWVAIQHPNNMVSLYAHFSAFAPLAVGTIVKQGQVIGYEGNTGEVTGSHVHLSIYKDFFTYQNPTNGQLYFNYMQGTVNPLDYL
ncbi:MAG TPA: peptidoglycan DD-metalloendopeptidase family protein [Candidatus Paceibacterota bacterium]|nr:peptidoglycan DD-metalloendopeptidase family protein [Candidatus Paceibacterota bacterium]